MEWQMQMPLTAQRRQRLSLNCKPFCYQSSIPVDVQGTESNWNAQQCEWSKYQCITLGLRIEVVVCECFVGRIHFLRFTLKSAFFIRLYHYRYYSQSLALICSSRICLFSFFRSFSFAHSPVALSLCTGVYSYDTVRHGNIHAHHQPTCVDSLRRKFWKSQHTHVCLCI